MHRNVFFVVVGLGLLSLLAAGWASSLLLAEASGRLSDTLVVSTRPIVPYMVHSATPTHRVVTHAPAQAAATLVRPPPPSPPPSTLPPPLPPAYASAVSNAYPTGQCTWWADARYHTLAGYYVPWAGDAYAWLMGAQVSGWHTSTTPPSGSASIIVLQPGVQGADTTDGHVGVVEQINSDGSVTTSDLNWGDAPTQVTHVIFQPGAGVSFVWAM